MKISELIEKLTKIQEKHGDIKVTCMHASLPFGFKYSPSSARPDVFETTVEQLFVYKKGEVGDVHIDDAESMGKRVFIRM